MIGMHYMCCLRQPFLLLQLYSYDTGADADLCKCMVEFFARL